MQDVPVRKTVTIVIPTYNEEENIPLIYERIVNLFQNGMANAYQMELLFIDNCSIDRSRDIILSLAQSDVRVKAIFNARNFGYMRSTFYGVTQAEGDCAILINADMQDPPDVIPKFLKEWEKGKKVVVGVKSASRENPLMYFLRQCYYSFIRKTSDIEHIDQFDGFGLYDRSFIEVLKNLDDPMPYLRGIVAELGFQRSQVEYTQEKRNHGKSKANFFKLYDDAMLGITSYSKVLMRLATMTGFAVAVISLIVAIFVFFSKIFNWSTYPGGTASIAVGVFFFGAVQLFFIGILGEYILNINIRILHRPVVIEEQRINFEGTAEDDDGVTADAK